MEEGPNGIQNSRMTEWQNHSTVDIGRMAEWQNHSTADIGRMTD